MLFTECETPIMRPDNGPAELELLLLGLEKGRYLARVRIGGMVIHHSVNAFMLSDYMDFYRHTGALRQDKVPRVEGLNQVRISMGHNPFFAVSSIPLHDVAVGFHVLAVSLIPETSYVLPQEPRSGGGLPGNCFAAYPPGQSDKWQGGN